MEKTATVLLVSADQSDHDALLAMLEGTRWRVRTARTFQQAWDLLHEREVQVVLAECDSAGAFCWRDLLDELDNMHGGPPLVLVSGRADGALWAEALSRGAYDVLAKPMDAAEVGRVLEMAALHGGESGCWKPRALGARGFTQRG